ncbi:hypothetical protein QFZ81_003022 [Paenibacillus sp. V4I9]|nr:hypothetical protein [Paenibacillus sp. V4I9]
MINRLTHYQLRKESCSIMLTLFYSFGTTLQLWSLRFRDLASMPCKKSPEGLTLALLLVDRRRMQSLFMLPSLLLMFHIPSAVQSDVPRYNHWFRFEPPNNPFHGCTTFRESATLFSLSMA